MQATVTNEGADAVPVVTLDRGGLMYDVAPGTTCWLYSEEIAGAWIGEPAGVLATLLAELSPLALGVRLLFDRLRAARTSTTMEVSIFNQGPTPLVATPDGGAGVTIGVGETQSVTATDAIELRTT